MPVYEGPHWLNANNAPVTTVTWSFATSNFGSLASQYPGYVSFDSSISTTYMADVRASFAKWEAVAAIDFVEVADSASSNIRIGNHTIDGTPAAGQSSTTALTQFWFSGSNFSAAEIYFDTDAYTSDAVFMETATHEIGHSLGLGHSSDPNNIMYFSTSPQNLDGLLSADDIAGAVHLYGAAGSAPANNAPTSSAPASAITAFLTGLSPTQFEFSTRADFCQAQYNYYANVLHVSNPQLGPYEALGKAFGDTAVFASKYGLSVDTSTTAFVMDVYQKVFAIAPSAIQRDHFVSQVEYYTNFFKSIGAPDASAQLEARGAVMGQMVGIVMTDTSLSSKPGNVLDDQVNSFLTKVASGNNAIFGQAWATAAANTSTVAADTYTSGADIPAADQIIIGQAALSHELLML